jgi:hypothetical protein
MAADANPADPAAIPIFRRESHTLSFVKWKICHNRRLANLILVFGMRLLGA